MNSDNRTTKLKKNYSTVEAVATAIAVYEHNDRIIVRDITETENKKSYPNRQLIKEALEGDCTHICLNDFYIKQAEGIIQYLQQTVIMQSLQNKVDRFLGQMTELLSNQEVSNKDIGILAWAPHLADQYQKKDHVREVSARFERHSRYIGHPRDKVIIDFTMIEKRYIQTMDCWAVYGSDAQDNLVFYWAKTTDKICEVGKISGRIKAHNEDKFRGNAKVTTLNYVKVL
jgi:hypothetical protein